MILLTLTAGASATTWYVPSPECPTIQAGIDAASYGDSVVVSCDTYYEHDIVLRSGVSLQSETGEAGCVVIDATGDGRVFYCESLDGSTLIRGFTVTGGFASSGGGAYCGDYSAPVLENVLFEGNRAQSGGGLWCGGGSTPILTNVAFVGNRATTGGGVSLSESSPEWQGVVFSGNSATADGGGLYCVSVPTTAELRSCTFSDNTAANGGGLFCDEGASPDVVNCTFARNSATQAGGGIYCAAHCYALFLFDLIAFSENGEGIYSVGAPVVYTCDVYGNAGGEYGGTLGDQTGTNEHLRGSLVLRVVER